MYETAILYRSYGLINRLVVAERSVCCRREFVKIRGDIRSENAGMSNDKQCEKSLSPKV